MCSRCEAVERVCLGYRQKVTVSSGTDNWLKTARRLAQASEPLSELVELLPSWSGSESEVQDSERPPSDSEKPPAAAQLCCRDGEALGDRPQGEQPESGEGRKGELGPAAEACCWAGEASKAESISSRAQESTSLTSAQEGGEANGSGGGAAFRAGWGGAEGNPAKLKLCLMRGRLCVGEDEGGGCAALEEEEKEEEREKGFSSSPLWTKWQRTP